EVAALEADPRAGELVVAVQAEDVGREADLAERAAAVSHLQASVVAALGVDEHLATVQEHRGEEVGGHAGAGFTHLLVARLDHHLVRDEMEVVQLAGGGAAQAGDPQLGGRVAVYRPAAGGGDWRRLWRSQRVAPRWGD